MSVGPADQDYGEHQTNATSSRNVQSSGCEVKLIGSWTARAERGNRGRDGIHDFDGGLASRELLEA